jgi:hypothetical protein
MVNVRQYFVPAAGIWPSETESPAGTCETRGAESTIWPRPSTNSPELHAAALRLQSAAGADAAGIAAALHCKVEAAPLLLRVAEAKVASLLRAPDPLGRRGSGTTGQGPDSSTNRATDGTDRMGREANAGDGLRGHQRRLDITRDAAGPCRRPLKEDR